MSLMPAGLALTAVLLASGTALAQDTPVWEKSYSVADQPMLDFEVSDSNLTIHSCGECRQVHVRVLLKNKKLSDYVLDEGQSGNKVRFSLKDKPHIGVHFNWHGPESRSEVLIEAPAKVVLEARTQDGGLFVSGLRGDLNLRTSDGGQELDHLAGVLKLETSDGHIRLQESSGTVDARTSDGSMDVAGSFSALQLHSSDGSIRADLTKSGNLSAQSLVESSDGGVTLLLPRSFAAEFDIRTHDGGIRSNLPLTLDGYNSKGDEGHAIHGKMNGGGALLTIRTDDGGVRLNTAS
jgi:hypothetical protein